MKYISSEEGQAGTMILVIAVVGILVVAGIILVSNQGSTAIRDTTDQEFTSEEFIEEQNLEGTVDGGAVRITDIIANPEQYMNTTVTIQGEIDRVINDRSFVLDQQGTVAGDEILVITQTQISPSIEAEDLNPFTATNIVRLTGTVRQLITNEVEEELGIDLETEIETEFEEKIVIIASNVSVLDAEGNSMRYEEQNAPTELPEVSNP